MMEHNFQIPERRAKIVFDPEGGLNQMSYVFGIIGVLLAIGFNIGWVSYINDQWLLSMILLGCVAALPLRFWCPLVDRIKPQFQLISIVVPAVATLIGFLIVDVFYIEWVPAAPTLAEQLRITITERLLSFQVVIVAFLSVYIGYLVAMSGTRITS